MIMLAGILEQQRFSNPISGYNPLSPLNFAGLTYWIDAEYSPYVIDSSNQLISINDLSNGANHFVNNRSNNLPMLEENIIQNNDVIKFSNLERIGTFAFNITQDFDFILVAKPLKTITYQSPTTSGTQGTSGQRYCLYPEKSNYLGLSYGNNAIASYVHGNGYLYPIASAEINSSGFKLIRIKVVNNQVEIYFNEVLISTNSNNTRILKPTHSLGSKAYNLNGDSAQIASICLYDRVLNSTEYAKVASYFINRFNLT